VITEIVCGSYAVDPTRKRNSGMMDGKLLQRNLMSELDVIKNTKDGPVTVESIKKDLVNLGVLKGMVLLVHSSLSSLGWVSGGPVGVILALEEVLGPEGTLVMPTHSGDLTDPEKWENPPVPERWKEIIRQTMPAFDPDFTPTRGMGRISETFRKQAGVLRSNHPHVSFAARGKHAEFITGSHGLHFGMGEDSPLARVYELEGWILFLGVGHENNTSMHLAEFRAEFPGKKEIQQGAPIVQDGVRRWVKFNELEENSEEFEEIGKAYQKSGGKILTGQVGNAQVELIPQQNLVDFTVGWMNKNRK
jgi:aminoglycoside 3-N-acetyltransferase